MKKLTLAILLAGAVAGMAAAQHSRHEGKGPMIEKKEVRVRMDRDCHEGMGRMGMGHGQWWENPTAVKELGLTEKQAEQIEGLSLNHRKAVIKLEADLKIAELEMRSLMDGDPSDSDVRKRAKAVSQLREKMHEMGIEHMLAVRKALTPEQQKKLKDLKAGGRGHRRMMEKGGCEGMPCPPASPEPPSSPR